MRSPIPASRLMPGDLIELEMFVNPPEPMLIQAEVKALKVEGEKVKIYFTSYDAPNLTGSIVKQDDESILVLEFSKLNWYNIQLVDTKGTPNATV